MKFDWGHLAAKGQKTRASLMNSSAMRCVKAFQREEDGAGTLLSFYVTLMILLMAGLGVDTMRHEMERTHLQFTLDAAVLAGAGSPVGTDAEEIATVVEDYFAKNDMSEFLNDIDLEGDDADIETSLNATRVFASADMEVDTYLLQMTGVETLRASGQAEAQVATPKLEVSLVLDVSGSMGGQKLTDMQAAARSFVTTILNQSDPGNAFISVVPFAWNVTPSPEIFEAMKVTEEHDYATCIRFDDSDYSEEFIDPDTTYNLQEFTSVYDDGFDALDTWWRTCYTDTNAEILPYSTSETDLHAHINALTANGNTSAHIGMKWGAALLDDEFQDVADDLREAEIVDATLTNIPAVYGEAETLKVIVLMADGDNTYSYYFDEASAYLGSDSDLFEVVWQDMVFDYAWREKKKGGTKYSNDESKCSKSAWTCVYKADGPEHSAYYLYDDANDRYLDIEATEAGDENAWITVEDFAAFSDEMEHVSSTALDWEIAWGFMSPHYYGDKLGDWGPWNDFVGSEFDNGSIKDGLMQSICSATKNQGVVVYTIGYDITANGNAENQLEACASSLNNYYPTDGQDISAAFNSIASNVKNLRLTQ